MTTILGLGTFPIRMPLHGGQRRIDAFKSFYARLHINYEYICLYDPMAYGGAAVGPLDIPYKPFDSVLSRLPYVMDVDAGEYAANDEAVFKHFFESALRCAPDAIQLEHPFMWPLVRRLRQTPEFRNTPVIFSSHNYEAPLKETMLLNAGIPRKVAKSIRDRIDTLETEVLTAASLTVGVSAADIASYKDLGLRSASLIVRNGVSSVKPEKWEKFVTDGFDGKYFLFVGSAYLPNTQGFQYYVLREGLFFLPPEKTFAVCGGVSEGVFQSHDYQMNERSYGRRVHFFPSIADPHLAWVRDAAHAVVLPIRDGGGSNLKTAEALVSGNWIIASPKAFRSFEEFKDDPGVIIARSSAEFAEAMADVYNKPPLVLDAKSRQRRRNLYWEECFDKSELRSHLGDLFRRSFNIDPNYGWAQVSPQFLPVGDTSRS
ncbi:glycosyltransferase [Sinorhizobium sp. M4_45]|uniref:glycosyltransferase n=1 Tax=Sinorhizobium sp. M4_45 TaxID=2037901 RepID=UPI0011AED781|nr:glycosyltransferase [Sinorhizobium sp. M4_45]